MVLGSGPAPQVEPPQTCPKGEQVLVVFVAGHGETLICRITMLPSKVISDVSSAQPVPPRDVRHLGDFSTSSRVLLITALALPIGAVSAVVAWGLLKLIGLITNAVFYQRVDTSLVAPGATHHNPFLVLLAPAVGGLVIGLMARYGSEKIRGHGMP